MGNAPSNGSAGAVGQPPDGRQPQQQQQPPHQQQQQQQQQPPRGPYTHHPPGYGGKQQQQQQQQHPAYGYGGPTPGPIDVGTAPPAGSGASRRSTSDTSMSTSSDPPSTTTNSTTTTTTTSTMNHHHMSAPNNLDMSLLTATDDDTVPTVFRWEHGGRQVYITGTFNGWSRQIPMHRSGNDFTYIHNLKRGKHAFKFIVDDEWRFAPDQPTVADIDGRINNFIDVTEFKAYTGDRDFEKEKAAAEYGCTYTPPPPAGGGGGGGGGSGVSPGGSAAPGGNDAGAAGGAGSKNQETKNESGPDGETKEADGTTSDKRGTFPDPDGEIFSHIVPDIDEYTKEPPPLPPHLRHIILNKPPQLQDTAALPVPQHVALNHLYCTAIKDNMMVLGITQRYKTKFVTTVYYSPCSS